MPAKIYALLNTQLQLSTDLQQQVGTLRNAAHLQRRFLIQQLVPVEEQMLIGLQNFKLFRNLQVSSNISVKSQPF